MQSPLVRLAGARKIYRRGLLEQHALMGVDLEIRAGEYVAILGPSGAGKSTLLQVIGLLEPLDAGTLELDGRSVATLRDEESSALRNTTFGFVFPDGFLVRDLDVYGNVELPLRYRRLDADARSQRVRAALDRVGLTGRGSRRPDELSAAQQQRVSVARALVGEPRLLLIDEPTRRLDSRSADRLLELFAELHAAGITMLLASHSAETVQHASRRLHLVDGRILEWHA